MNENRHNCICFYYDDNIYFKQFPEPDLGCLLLLVHPFSPIFGIIFIYPHSVNTKFARLHMLFIAYNLKVKKSYDIVVVFILLNV